MRVICLIDHILSGGAQRQICMLAVLLKERGFDVQLMTYYESDFFLPLLEKGGVPVSNISFKNQIDRILSLRKAIRCSKPDVVISYLDIPNLLAEVTGFLSRKYSLIVSERNTEFDGRPINSSVRFFFHRFADAVVSNSYAQHNFIGKNAPGLKSRLKTITNCLDLDTFRPPEKREVDDPDEIYLLVLARFEHHKNPFALLSAIEIIKDEHPELKVFVDWYGNNYFQNGHPTKLSDCFLQLKDTIFERNLQDRFRLHNQQLDTVTLYQQSSVFCLPSLYEGFSNVIGEAMACGKIVLASRVGDNERLIAEGETGFFFDPDSPRDIANVILRVSSLSREDRKRMEAESRKRAESMLSSSRFVENYIELIEEIKKRRKKNRVEKT